MNLDTFCIIVGVYEIMIGIPLMVKPSHEGSSIGMAKVDNEAELAAAHGDLPGLGPDRHADPADRLHAGRGA